MALLASTRHEVDTPEFPLWLMAVVPVLALGLQSLLSLHFPRFDVLDLPLLVTIYFAITWRNPIGATLIGCFIGIFQDALTQHPLGVYGIAKSIVGFMASSLGVRLDTENNGSRLLVITGFTLLHSGIVWLLEERLINQPYAWIWLHEGIRAVANAFFGIILFALLDRARRRD
jgi:rod shape-determining protein MreD